jgi:phosphomannomutase
MSYGKRITWLKEQRTPVVLFDMDGTLTEPRSSLDKDLVPLLEDLSDIAEIGVVTGSDFDYLKQQISFLMDRSKIRYKLHLLPCNGTKYYKPPATATEDHILKYEKNMLEELGQEKFRSLMIGILEVQEHISKLRIPLTGHFVDYRGSMINWCPIGRNANKLQRREFISMDNERTPSLREKYLTRLRIKVEYTTRDVVCKLGGDTSFDIYPSGWDKTYALKHFKNHRDIYFVGDRCQEDGNDYEIYKALNSRAYETTSTIQTQEIIKDIILRIKSN